MAKQGIHPHYNEITVQFASGTTCQTSATHTRAILVEICSACHPFFTGKQKMVDTAGRIERFRRKFAQKETPAAK